MTRGFAYYTGISIQIYKIHLYRNTKFIKTQILPDTDSQEICGLVQMKRESYSLLISQAECLFAPLSNYNATGSFVDDRHKVSGSNLKYPTTRGGSKVVSGTETCKDRQKL